MLRVNLLERAKGLYWTSPDLKKWNKCRWQHMLGEFHPHTFLVANLINNRPFRLYILFSQYRSCDDTQEI